MPENFVYNADFTDDRRSPPEPALSKVEWAGMTKRGRGVGAADKKARSVNGLVGKLFDA